MLVKPNGCWPYEGINPGVPEVIISCGWFSIKRFKLIKTQINNLKFIRLKYHYHKLFVEFGHCFSLH